jgi:hypothetical protein
MKLGSARPIVRPTPEFATSPAFLGIVYTDQAVALILIATSSDGFAILLAVVAKSPA